MDFGNIDLDAIGDILSTLSDEDVENLSKMATQLFGSDGEKTGDSEENGPKRKDSNGGEKKGRADSFGFQDMPFDTESMMRIFSLMNKLKNQPEDNRVRLLYALKPMLSPERRHKVDQAAQMIKIMSLLTLLKE